MNTGLHLIQQERLRQITEENYDVAHDDVHCRGLLAVAASLYAMPPMMEDKITSLLEAVDYSKVDKSQPDLRSLRDMWPWASHYDKRGEYSRVRRLQVAGALIAAEIDRLLRLGET